MKLAIVALSACAAVPAMAQPYYPYRPYAPYVAPPAYVPAPAYVPPSTYVPPSSYAPAMTHRELVNEIQDELEEHGYRPGPYDGVLDGETIAAIRAYQRDSGLPVTGEATPSLLDHLRSTPPSARGTPSYPAPSYSQPTYASPSYQSPSYQSPSYSPPPASYSRESGPYYSQPPGTTQPAYPSGQGVYDTQRPGTTPPTSTYAPPAYAPPADPNQPPTYTNRPEPLTPQYMARPEMTSRGDPDVAWVQGALQRRGYSPGPADGMMGERTRRAIEAFQRDNGMAPDGTIGPGLLAKLR